MKFRLFIITALLLLSTHASVGALAHALDPTQILLPETFEVYVHGETVINHPDEGFSEVALPTVNLYKGSPGCYIACYSQREEHSVYPAGKNIYLMGQVRVAGKYAGRICEPTNFAGKDISGHDPFKALCNEKIPSCAGAHCWAGGDTGGWFGIY